MSRFLIHFLISVFLSNCVSSSPKLESIEEMKKSVLESSFEQSLVTGGQWLKNAPIIVNRDFDMAIAMSIEMVGPAIAAGQRIKKNKAIVEALDSVELSISEEITDCLPRCNVFLEDKIRVFGLLYGSKSARLATVVEVIKGGVNKRFISISQPNLLAGEGSWADKSEAAINKEVSKSLIRIAEYWRVAPTGKKQLRCNVGDNTYIKGVGEGLRGSDLLMKSTSMADTVVICEHEN